MEARQYSELCDITFIANNTQPKYALSLKEKYRAIIDPSAAKLPEKPGGPVFESGSDDALKLMRGVGRGMKRYLGYGGR